MVLVYHRIIDFISQDAKFTFDIERDALKGKRRSGNIYPRVIRSCLEAEFSAPYDFRIGVEAQTVCIRCRNLIVPHELDL